ncbi:TetR/AcrR family transcriptional regulator [Luteimonas sp. S4-F44]|uniref:TetR/AcrR family transcriptional regulator n=1 Tax=Luteimonas sp. S4-F44 TaxID=2925842 RepID=UPI001F53628C|nr:TetR/AcrR family transcriptional regulator [Luteimonas sp. S4-F44]UNK42708.1 TetR/AcrR family transcriptional regulator [Luteimonas sp. S4-F44]
MPSRTSPRLDARKKPRQARALATLDAIFEATIQVLLTDGPYRLTTTRVALRAGVSVGTMYQYFPNKQALFYALNERYMDTLAEKVETTCKARHGIPVRQMVEALLTTYWNAKMERPDVTQALYRAIAELDNGPLIEAFGRRVDAATTTMLSSASDAVFTDLPGVNLTLLTTIFGTVRNVFERNLPSTEAEAVREQLLLMCTAYLEAVSAQRTPGANPAALRCGCDAAATAS